MMKTSIKLKFRPSVKLDKEGTLYYQLIFNRRVKHLNTPYKIMLSEWDDKNGCIFFRMLILYVTINWNPLFAAFNGIFKDWRK